MEPTGIVWNVAGGSSGFVLCCGQNPDGWLLWRVLRQGRDGIAIIDRIYYSGRELIQDWFQPLVDGDEEVVSAFAKAVERYCGLRDVWREYVREFLRTSARFDDNKPAESVAMSPESSV